MSELVAFAFLHTIGLVRRIKSARRGRIREICCDAARDEHRSESNDRRLCANAGCHRDRPAALMPWRALYDTDQIRLSRLDSLCVVLEVPDRCDLRHCCSFLHWGDDPRIAFCQASENLNVNVNDASRLCGYGIDRRPRTSPRACRVDGLESRRDAYYDDGLGSPPGAYESDGPGSPHGACGGDGLGNSLDACGRDDLARNLWRATEIDDCGDGVCGYDDVSSRLCVSLCARLRLLQSSSSDRDL